MVGRGKVVSLILKLLWKSFLKEKPRILSSGLCLIIFLQGWLSHNWRNNQSSLIVQANYNFVLGFLETLSKEFPRQNHSLCKYKLLMTLCNLTFFFVVRLRHSLSYLFCHFIKLIRFLLFLSHKLSFNNDKFSLFIC